jgi:hypothetical protein
MREQQFVKPQDFDSMETWIHMLNETTQTQFRDGKRFYGEEYQSEDHIDQFIRLIDFSHNILTLSVPLNSCSSGHRITIDIFCSFGRIKIHREISGYVKDISKQNEEDTLFLKLNHINQKKCEDYFQVIEERQNEIEHFFQKAKGAI